MPSHAGCADERSGSEGADMHVEAASVGGSSLCELQRHGPAPDGDGALVAQELIRAQPRPVLVRADAPLQTLPFERVEIAMVGGSAELRPDTAERRHEIASSQAAGIDTGSPCLFDAE